MKLIILCIFLISISLNVASIFSYEDYDEDIISADLVRSRRFLMGKCVSDHECQPFEYCDHSGINPIGKCTPGKELKSSCVFDRHCKSKHCHHMKCVVRKPVKDGPCAPNEHTECIPTQYCSHKEKIYRCRDRKCSGLCGKDAHCFSNKCTFFSCKKPAEGCPKV